MNTDKYIYANKSGLGSPGPGVSIRENWRVSSVGKGKRGRSEKKPLVKGLALVLVYVIECVFFIRILKQMRFNIVKFSVEPYMVQDFSPKDNPEY
jgi:hypothetical protein